MEIDERLFVSAPSDAEPQHRWSGWPGAWCLDCGTADALEECLAVHDIDCEICHNVPCPTPGARKFDPYNPK